MASLSRSNAIFQRHQVGLSALTSARLVKLKPMRKSVHALVSRMAAHGVLYRGWRVRNMGGACERMETKFYTTYYKWKL